MSDHDNPNEPAEAFDPDLVALFNQDDQATEQAQQKPVARPEQRGRRTHRGRTIVLALVGAVVVVVLGFVLWFNHESGAHGAPGAAVVINVKDGESISSVATTLSNDGVIDSALAFHLYGFLHGSPTPSPGLYQLHKNLSFSEIHTILSGLPNVHAMSVDPGLTLHEVAERVGDLPGFSATGFEALAKSGTVRSTYAPAGSDNLEGLLGTGVYQVLPDESATTLLSDMVQRFDAQASAAGLNSVSANALGLSEYEVIIAASVVQKEGYYDKNMPDVARVIYNRLAANTPLQMDSTVLYALGQDGGPVTSADLKVQSPYNTYLNHGLPPTPICMSSPAALSAAAHPPPGAWLYFVVVDKSGTEAFADTFSEQLANERLAQSRGVG